MAINVVIPLLIDLEENLINATRLLPSDPPGPLKFTEIRYCTIVPENAPLNTEIANVIATHKDGFPVRYSITGGNRDGLFTIDAKSGFISLAAHPDYEHKEKHLLEVSAEAGGNKVRTSLHVLIADVNDNSPVFEKFKKKVTIIEEDDRNLPKLLLKVPVSDPDVVDENRLQFYIQGEGVRRDTPGGPIFSINSDTGEVFLLRAVDRDPPYGRSMYKIKILVKDGPNFKSNQHKLLPSRSNKRNKLRQHLTKRLRTVKRSIIDKSFGVRNVNLNISKSSGGTNDVLKPVTKDATTRISLSDKELRINENLKLQRETRNESFHLFLRRIQSSSQLYDNNDRTFLEDPKRNKIVCQGPTSVTKKCSNINGKYIFALMKGDVMTDRQNLESGTKNENSLSNVKWYNHNFSKRHLKSDVSLSIEHGKTLTEDPHLHKFYKFPLNIVKIKCQKTLVSFDSNNDILPLRSQRKPFFGTDQSLMPRKATSECFQIASASKMDNPTTSCLNEFSIENQLFCLQDSVYRILERIHFSCLKSNLYFWSPYLIDREKCDSICLFKYVFKDLILRSISDQINVSKIIPTDDRITELPLSITLPYICDYNYLAQINSDKVATKKLKHNPQKSERNSSNISNKKLSPHRNSECRKLNIYLPQPGLKHNSQDLIGIKNTSNKTKFRQKSTKSVLGNIENTNRSRKIDASNPKPKYNSKRKRDLRRKNSSSISVNDDNDSKKKEFTNEFCVLTNPDIRMIQPNVPFGNQYEPLQDKQLAPFMSKIYMETTEQHEASVLLTVLVKDINDNVPVFPNTTMYGEVQENGPIDLSVTTVTAWDSDDATSGTNARLTYSLEKNVIDEKTGEELFRIHPRTGELHTALCCLDRETTPEYRILVVASDGGGLKGSGTVIIRLADVNDNAPRMNKDEWFVKVDETSKPTNETLIELTVTDPDVTNYFSYRIVESSGNGWNYFNIRTVGSVGELFAISPLDYENQKQKNGFRFQVQVTDRGPGGWNDPRHIDSAYVNVTLQDINDNDPIFTSNITHVAVREDVPLDTVLARVPANDKDADSQGHIKYHLLENWGSLRVDADGAVRVWRPLDREGPGGLTGVIKVIATDQGEPKRSATATVTVTLQDVNDSPPRLLPPHVLHIKENYPPQQIGILKATDDDIWSKGHGPPFNFSLAKSNPPDILEKISLIYDPSLDDGRGGAKLFTLKPLDREEHRSLTVEISLSDNQGLTTSQPVFIIIDDQNDNKMKPGSKTVYLWKTREGGLDACLGRIYIEDPDDWDLADKSFLWVGPPHPLFNLNNNTGILYASSQLKEGRYNLKFEVSDSVWKQQHVKGNVTVIVRVLSQDALTHAVPLSLSPTTPSDLMKDWNPMNGGGILGSLVSSVRDHLEGQKGSVIVVSVYGSDVDSDPSYPPADRDFQSDSRNRSMIHKTHVWISYQEQDSTFMNPIKLRGILEMNIYKIREATSMLIYLKESYREDPVSDSTASLQENSSSSSLFPIPYQSNVPNLFLNNTSVYASATSLASTALPLQVVDNNATSFVTPRLQQTVSCKFPTYFKSTIDCLPDSCLNGGKCVSSEQGKKCVCPGGTLEPFCKISRRGFEKGGWAWIKPIPPCIPTTISLEILTTKSEGLIIYSGPLATASQSGYSSISHDAIRRQKYPVVSDTLYNYDRSKLAFWKSPEEYSSYTSALVSSSNKVSPLLALYLLNSKLHLSIQGSENEPALLILNSKHPINDGKWHNIHIKIDNKKVSLLTDYCIHGYRKYPTSSQHCYAVHEWATNVFLRQFWVTSGPVQIGGLAHRTPRMEDHGWTTQPVGTSLEGCISDLRIGGELIDLGAPAYSYNSHIGCNSQNNACIPRCGTRGVCSGGLGSEAFCECSSGYSGDTCDKRSVPVTLNHQSFSKCALSFAPNSLSIPVQIRLRTRQKDAIILSLTSEGAKLALILNIKKGIICFSLVDIKSNSHQIRDSGKNINETNSFIEMIPFSSSILKSVCVNEVFVNDGIWHTIKAAKFGNYLLLEIDNGDLNRRNETQVNDLEDPDTEASQSRSFPTEFKLDVRGGVTIGGIPDFNQRTPVTRVEFDLANACIDDVRIQHHPVPLPLVSNETKWGQVTAFQGFTTDCHAPDSCKGVTCDVPLVCRDEWRLAACRCPPGQQLTHRGCQEMDMCLFGPCLNGGSCIQDKTGMSCVCKPQFTGHNCEWEMTNGSLSSVFNPIVVASLLSTLFLIVFFVVICSINFYVKRKKRRRKAKEEEADRSSTAMGNKGRIESGEMEIFYIYDQSGSKDKVVTKKKDQLTQFETDISCSMFEQNKDPIWGLPKKLQVPPSILKTGDLISPSAKDDLRAYAYEGEGSSDASLTSALSGQIRSAPLHGGRSEINSDCSNYHKCPRTHEEHPRLKCKAEMPKTDGRRALPISNPDHLFKENCSSLRNENSEWVSNLPVSVSEIPEFTSVIPGFESETTGIKNPNRRDQPVASNKSADSFCYGGTGGISF